MRVAFIQNLWEELQGPLVLSEVLEREGHEVRFVLAERRWLRVLEQFSPQVVAMSVATGNHRWMLEAAGKIKHQLRPAPLVIMGGPHPTYFPEIIEEENVDAICRGEGDLALPALLAGVDRGELPREVPNFWIKRGGEISRNDLGPLVEDLDQIPFPSRRPLYDHYPFLKSSPYKRVVSSRGCPYKCTYCFNHKYRQMVKGKGRFIRRRSVGHVLEEIAYLSETFGFRHLDFYDDLFILDKMWVLEFAERFRDTIGKPWACSVHAKRLDEEIADALAASGCAFVAFGVESGSRRIRDEVMNKAIDEEDIRRCAGLLHERGIPFQTFNMVGLPGETLDEAFQTVRLNQEIRPFFAWCSVAIPLPGTRFSEICEEMGALPSGLSMDELVEHSWFDRSTIELEQKREITNLQKFFSVLVKYPRLEPAIRPLLSLPQNVLFRLISQFFYGYHMKIRSNMSWWRALYLYLRVARLY